LLSACSGQWEISESRRRVTAPNGAEIWVKSADHEDGLRGAGLNGLVIDECRDIDGRAWREVLRPAIADKKGWVVFASTPRGFDWFFELYQQAEDKPGWERWTQTTFDNPEIDPSEIEDMRLDMPDRHFRQEIMAEFLDDAGGVFIGVASLATILEPDNVLSHQNHHVVVGIDWAKHSDFTVLTAYCSDCRRVVDWGRFNQIDYFFQRDRLR